MHILLVEDERSLSDPVRRGLTEEGYRVDVAADGETGLRRALAESFDILLVDWRLPGIDGRTLVERVRGAELEVPVIMLTALRDLEYVVAGLDAGADDYLTKPFSFVELLARIRAVIRRRESGRVPIGQTPSRFVVGQLRIDALRRTAELGGASLELRAKEYALLQYLARLSGAVATRTRIAEHVWGSAFDVTDNALDITVFNLRQRLREAGDSVRIETIRGVGYRLISEFDDHE